ncbi:MAG: hypothetical protein EXS08_15665 [Planctomycetes bacterium]|nr:hypothetical protein [Planctomycetota bacterium]
MKNDAPKPTVVQLEYEEFVELLVARRPLERVWPRNCHETALRAALRDTKTGALYAPRLVSSRRASAPQ